MRFKMGLREFYAPEGTPAGGTDGSGAPVGAPEESNAGSGSAKTPAWMAQLPGDLKTDESLAKYATVGDAIKGLMENQGKPEEKKESGPVKYENFAKKLNVDDDPFGEIGEGLKSYLEKKGRTQADAEEFFDSFSEVLKTAKGNMIKNGRELCEKAVKAQWGSEYEAKRALMAKGYLALGDTDGSLQRALDESGASLSPATWELLSRIGRLVSEDSGSPVKGTGGAVRKGGVPIDYSKPSV